MEDPAHTRSIRTKLCLNALGQSGGDFTQIFKRPASRPVQIRPIFENDVNIRKSEIRKTPNRLHLRSAEHGSDNGVRHLIFHNVGASVPAGIDNDLRIREIRNGIQRDIFNGPDRSRDRSGREDENEELIVGGKLDDFLDKTALS